MIKYLLTLNRPVFWVIFHLVLGVVSIFTPWVLIFWFYLSLLGSLYYGLQANSSSSLLVAIITYFVSFELLARMSEASPYIPYEMGKYLLFILLILGILKFKTNAIGAFFMILFLVPGLFLDLSGRVRTLDLVFNFMGPLNVGLAILFCYGKKVSFKRFWNIIRLAIYPMIGVFAQSFFKTPDLESVEFELGANSIASGGFGSNQVSTGLGLAAFLVFAFWINRYKFTPYRWLDLCLILLLAGQGLLTFSRGGMVGTALGILIILFFLRMATYKEVVKYRLVRIGKLMIPAMLVIVGVFYAINKFTNGMLLLRYSGETKGTLAGAKVKSLNTLTSGRFAIFDGDLSLFLDHPILGVGVGASRYLRETMTNIVAHVELSRLMAEHGILGLIYFGILIFYGVQILRNNKNPALKGVLFALYMLGVYTSFHAAMRTFISPLMIGISVLAVQDPKFVKNEEEKRKLKKSNLVKPINQNVITI